MQDTLVIKWCQVVVVYLFVCDRCVCCCCVRAEGQLTMELAGHPQV